MSTELSARFAFARLVVRDLAKQAAFYRAAFGYGEGLTIRDAINGRAIEEVIFNAPDGKVELILLQFQDGPAPSPTGVMIGFYTQDLDALQARVLAAGGEVAQPIGPLQMPAGPTRFAFFADPEGHLLEVIER
jgi:predicted enzyme related to lactoylglutathione lyase